MVGLYSGEFYTFICSYICEYQILIWNKYESNNHDSAIPLVVTPQTATFDCNADFRMCLQPGFEQNITRSLVAIAWLINTYEA